MKDSAVRHLACSPTSPYLAAALFEDTVLIWNLDTLSQVGEFETILTFGGKRLALDAAGQLCIAAGWGRGIAAYGVPSGEVLWHRKDLKHVQVVTLDPSGTKIYCGRDVGALHILESYTGETIDRLPGVEEVIESPFNTQLLLETRGDRDYMVKGQNNFRVKRLGFALLDGAFGEEFLCLSEARGPVRGFDCGTGAELWRFLPESGSHVFKLGYRIADGFFYGVLGNFERGGICNLLRFEAGSGKRSEICPLDTWETQFCRAGEMLVTHKGTLFNVAEGTILGTLEFPTQEYPDK